MILRTRDGRRRPLRFGRWGRERPNGPAAKHVRSAILAEQVEALFRQMPLALAVNLINAALLAAALTPFATWPPAPSLWFAAVALVVVARALLWQSRRRRPAAFDASDWSRWATLGALAAGLAWGGGGALLFSLVPSFGQALLTLVIGGMCTGAVVLGASHLPALIAFVLAASLPMALRYALAATPPAAALAAMIVVFAAALTLAARHLNRVFAEAMRLRFELHETNRRLVAEVARHRATETALRQAQKLEAVGRLTGGVAHDFNNLLTILIGNLALASERLGAAATVAPLIEEAVQAAERGAALSRRLLGFVREQRAGVQLVDICRLLADTTEMLRRTLGPQVELAVETTAEAAPVEVDPNQLELAILNLAINARDAMPGGGSLRIAVDGRDLDRPTADGLGGGRYIVVEISDTGGGMDEATLARAFDPFFTTKEPGAGTGLGLPMVQAFAMQSGGALRLASVPGRGTQAELWLRRAARATATPPPARPCPPARQKGGARILVCDDDDGVRRFIGDYLDSTGCSVRQTESAEAALRLIEEDAAIDLLIVDYAMPGMNGLDLVRRARQRRPGLSALLITGDSLAVPDAAGEIAILPKPFSPAELGRRVIEATAARQQADLAGLGAIRAASGSAMLSAPDFSGCDKPC